MFYPYRPRQDSLLEAHRPRQISACISPRLPGVRSLSLSIPPISWRRWTPRRRPTPWRRLDVAGALRQVFAIPFSGDKHPTGMPTPCIPFLLCENEHPNPNLRPWAIWLFVFGSDLITSVFVYYAYLLRSFLLKLSGVHVYTHILWFYWSAPVASAVLSRWLLVLSCWPVGRGVNRLRSKCFFTICLSP
jgi:hypothetical protein